MDGYSINKTEFGERMKSAREELKMTQTQLAQLLKTSQMFWQPSARQPGKVQIGCYLEATPSVSAMILHLNSGFATFCGY